MEHPGHIPTDGSDSTSGENNITLKVVGLSPFRAGGAEASQKPHYPIEEFPRRGELEKHLLDAAAAPAPLSVNLENLNCFSITEGEKGGGRRRGGMKGKKRRSGCEDAGQVPFIQLAASTACPQPRLKNKGAPATFHWKISGDSPDVLRDGYLTLRIKHERQRSLLGRSLPGAEEMKWRGRRMRSRVMGNPPDTSAHLC